MERTSGWVWWTFALTSVVTGLLVVALAVQLAFQPRWPAAYEDSLASRLNADYSVDPDGTRIAPMMPELVFDRLAERGQLGVTLPPGPLATLEAIASATATFTPTPTPTATDTPTPTPTFTSTPTPTDTPTPTFTPTPIPPTFTPTFAPTITPTVVITGTALPGPVPTSPPGGSKPTQPPPPTAEPTQPVSPLSTPAL